MIDQEHLYLSVTPFQYDSFLIQIADLCFDAVQTQSLCCGVYSSLCQLKKKKKEKNNNYCRVNGCLKFSYNLFFILDVVYLAVCPSWCLEQPFQLKPTSSLRLAAFSGGLAKGCNVALHLLWKCCTWGCAAKTFRNSTTFWPWEKRLFCPLLI